MDYVPTGEWEMFKPLSAAAAAADGRLLSSARIFCLFPLVLFIPAPVTVPVVYPHRPAGVAGKVPHRDNDITAGARVIGTCGISRELPHTCSARKLIKFAPKRQNNKSRADNRNSINCCMEISEPAAEASQPMSYAEFFK